MPRLAGLGGAAAALPDRVPVPVPVAPPPRVTDADPRDAPGHGRRGF
jgi:hypothetical protein